MLCQLWVARGQRYKSCIRNNCDDTTTSSFPRRRAKVIIQQSTHRLVMTTKPWTGRACVTRPAGMDEMRNSLTFIQEAQWRDTIHFLLCPRAATLAMYEFIVALYVYGARVHQNSFRALMTTHPIQFCDDIFVRASAMRPSTCRHTRPPRHDDSLLSTRVHGLKVTLSIISYFWVRVIVHFGF